MGGRAFFFLRSVGPGRLSARGGRGGGPSRAPAGRGFFADPAGGATLAARAGHPGERALWRAPRGVAATSGSGRPDRRDLSPRTWKRSAATDPCAAGLRLTAQRRARQRALVAGPWGWFRAHRRVSAARRPGAARAGPGSAGDRDVHPADTLNSPQTHGPFRKGPLARRPFDDAGSDWPRRGARVRTVKGPYARSPGDQAKSEPGAADGPRRA